MGFQFDLNKIKWQLDSNKLPEAVYKLKVPSVTTIINESIPDPEWDEFVRKVGKERADQILTSAGNRGSAMHIFIETFLETYSKTHDISEALRVTQEESPKILRSDNIPEDKINEGRDLFYKFYYSEYPNRYINIIAIELRIYSPSLFYRGKLDVLYNDSLYGISLSDLKSSNGRIKKNSVKEIKYFYQLGAYVNALEEMYAQKNLKVNRASILCVDKNTDIIQEIELNGERLVEYKEKFKELAKEYHIKIGQDYLIKK